MANTCRLGAIYLSRIHKNFLK